MIDMLGMLGMLGMWNRIVDWVTPLPPEWMRGPYKTSINHTVITVLGLWPILDGGWRPLGIRDGLGWRSTLGPLGILLYFTTGIPWLWLFASTMTGGWYWRREYKHTGLKPKPKIHERLSREAGYTVYRTFGQRWDTWMDAIFPTIALIIQCIVLL